MCGICGVIQLGGEPRPVIAPVILDAMTDTMSHRGPNDRGTYAEAGIALGVRRLSIVDVDGGHQPVSSEDGRIWAVQNGELYNHEALRGQLGRRGHRFTTRCDTEVLPHLYEEHGLDFPRELRGMFGIAVWDRARQRAVLARDRLGIKPLYYARNGDLVVFASELKSVLASGLVEPELDVGAIDAYLTLGYFPGPRTPLKGVLKLQPGHVLVADPSGMRVDSFWSYPEPSPGNLAEDEYEDALLAELEESVRLRLMSDVPLGAMLSGGLDSSLIVALMARNMSEPVKTFSVGFTHAGDANELDDAREIAELFGTEHHELELGLHEHGVDLAELVWYLDEPLADLSALGFLAISELASRHVRVALSGQGADELFGGYRKHQAAALCGVAPPLLRRPLAKAAGALAARGPRRLRRGAETLAARDPVSRLLAMSGKLDPAQRELLLCGELAELDGGTARSLAAAHVNGLRDDPLPAALFLDAQLALVDDMLHYFDRTSMAHSLEVRVPFLDHRFVEFAATVPPRLKVRGLNRKHILKRAARQLLPARIVDKPKVGFFRNSVDAWFDAQASAAVPEWLLAAEPRYSGLLDRNGVETLVARGREGRGESVGQLLLAILMLEIWLSTYLPRALGQTPDSPRERIELSA
jgi:asparagine synthase (glutamine-hydrolysing)